jgi:hypothetical protein
MQHAGAARGTHLHRRRAPTVAAMTSPYGYGERPVYALVRPDL